MKRDFAFVGERSFKEFLQYLDLIEKVTSMGVETRMRFWWHDFSDERKYAITLDKFSSCKLLLRQPLPDYALVHTPSSASASASGSAKAKDAKSSKADHDLDVD